MPVYLETAIIHYGWKQADHHGKAAFQEEFLVLLKAPEPIRRMILVGLISAAPPGLDIFAPDPGSELPGYSRFSLREMNSVSKASKLKARASRPCVSMGFF